VKVSHTATNATDQNGQAVTIGGSDVALQTITVGQGSITLAVGASNPVASNVVAGASNIQVGDFTFSANTASYNVSKLELKTTAASSSAINSVSIQYPNQSGVMQTATAAINGTTGVALFTNLSFYVPANGSADLSVWVSTPTINSGSTISGTKIAFTLPHVDGTNNQLQPVGGAVSYDFGGSDLNTNTAGYGFKVLRKSVPTFAGSSNSVTSAPNTSSTLYQFSVSADPAGAVDFKQFSFNVSTSSGVTLGGFQLFDAANPSIALNASGAAPIAGVITITTDNVVQIPAGGSKTFIVKASTGTFGSGAQNMSMSLAPADTVLITNTDASTVDSAYHYSWTDRSANSDAVTGQWTNGYLLRDLSGTYSFTTSS
ncbi:MAG: hypothetical protein ACREGR_02015, partial [Minisyncoccia bacterium]